MKNVLKPSLFACIALAFSMGCIAEVEDEDPDFRYAAQPAGGSCDEVYNYVVSGADKAEAQTNCDDTCAGVQCSDANEDALACIRPKAGDGNSWRCDCKCGCDDEDSACGPNGIDTLPF